MYVHKVMCFNHMICLLLIVVCRLYDWVSFHSFIRKYVGRHMQGQCRIQQHRLNLIQWLEVQLVTTSSWWWQGLLLLKMRLCAGSRNLWKEVSSWICNSRCVCFIELHAERIWNFTLVMVQLRKRCLVQILLGTCYPVRRCCCFPNLFTVRHSLITLLFITLSLNHWQLC